MTGLEKIISQIEYESNDRCKSIISQAEENAKGIIEKAEQQAKEIICNAEANAAKKAEDIKQSAASSAELGKSKVILKAKLEVIDDMLGKALASIKSLDDKEYFEIIKTLIANNAKEGEGVLRLSDSDVNRLPKDFISSVNSELGKGKSVILGDSTNTDGGFVLVYGDIDINCSFDAIAASKRDELRDALNALLFS